MKNKGVMFFKADYCKGVPKFISNMKEMISYIGNEEEEGEKHNYEFSNKSVTPNGHYILLDHLSLVYNYH